MSIFYFILIAIANLCIGFYAARFLNPSAPGAWENLYSTDRIPTDPAEAASEALAAPVPEQPAEPDQSVEEASAPEAGEAESEEEVPEEEAVEEVAAEEVAAEEDAEETPEENTEEASEEEAVAEETTEETPEETPEEALEETVEEASEESASEENPTQDAESEIAAPPANEEAEDETEEPPTAEVSDEAAEEESVEESSLLNEEQDSEPTAESADSEIDNETNSEESVEEEADEAESEAAEAPSAESDEPVATAETADAPDDEANDTTETAVTEDEKPADPTEELSAQEPSDVQEHEKVEKENTTSDSLEEASEQLESESPEHDTQPSDEEEALDQPEAQAEPKTEAEAPTEPVAEADDSDDTEEADPVSADSSGEAQDDPEDSSATSGEQDQNCPAYYLSELMSSSAKWTKEIKQADAEVRRGLENGATDHLADCFAQLENFTEHTLQQITPELERLAGLENLKPEVESTVSEIRSHFDQITTDSQAAVERLRSLDFAFAAEDATTQDAFPKALATLGDLFNTTSETRDKIALAHSRFSIMEDSEESAESSATTDELTGISTGSAARAKLEQLWKPNSPKPESVAIGVIDVDQQKKLNADFGVSANDALLIAIAHSAAVAVVGEQMAVRYSGQQFLFVLPETPVEEATEIVERIRQTIEANQYRYHEQHLPITVSAAVALDDLSGTPDELLDRANLALREAKSQGGNRTFLHEGSSIAPVEPPSMGISGNEVELE